MVAAGRAAPAMIRAKADGGGEPAGPRNRVAVDHVRDLRPIGRPAPVRCKSSVCSSVMATSSSARALSITATSRCGAPPPVAPDLSDREAILERHEPPDSNVFVA